MIGVMIYLKSLPFNYSFTKALGFNIPLTFHHIMLIDVVMVISVAVLWTARRDLLYFNLRQKRKQTFFLTVIFSLLAYGLVASLILLTPVNASFLPKLVLVISLLPLLLELGARMFYTPIKPGKKIYEMANAGEYGKNTPSYHSKQFVSTQEFLNNIVNNPPNALNVEATMY
ncbi:uncharacterized protein VICG_01924 [Vittaforma corneae ATCC 50505]|uniref:Uncharacterized protein n=1 Tax=Vittaforma corneae (strain ATCC 50505) TaxID=993615 RepID=L2GL63_VITCO|nr:uncharacterized protein VICG_01924 [Vittaforma corneae ATCC 50505]ELA41042.1 hypothetical protein VICG_01924 [Vittaforma corneae ATCC 50505]